MELCVSDPPPWIAIRDHSFSFYFFCCPALSPRFPSSIPPMKVRELRLRTCVFVCMCALVFMYEWCATARIAVSAVRSARAYCLNYSLKNQRTIQSALRWHRTSPANWIRSPADSNNQRVNLNPDQNKPDKVARSPIIWLRELNSFQIEMNKLSNVETASKEAWLWGEWMWRNSDICVYMRCACLSVLPKNPFGVDAPVTG